MVLVLHRIIKMHIVKQTSLYLSMYLSMREDPIGWAINLENAADDGDESKVLTKIENFFD